MWLLRLATLWAAPVGLVTHMRGAAWRCQGDDRTLLWLACVLICWQLLQAALLVVDAEICDDPFLLPFSTFYYRLLPHHCWCRHIRVQWARYGAEPRIPSPLDLCSCRHSLHL